MKEKNFTQRLSLLGCACSLAGANSQCHLAPALIRDSIYLQRLIDNGLALQWEVLLAQRQLKEVTKPAILQEVSALAKIFAEEVMLQIEQKHPFLVIGGDHSCALGTWSGVAQNYKAQGDIGLIWIDAHMDSHTPQTSLTQNIHGMPLAALMGYGAPELTHILSNEPKLKPEHVCLIGVRSFEAGEAALLKKLNVKIYFMEEVKLRGFKTVLNEAVAQVSANTVGYGISLDLDSIDPDDAPAVDVPEKGGIRAPVLLAALREIAADPQLLTAEIVEFDPIHDKKQMTEKLVVALIEIFAKGKLCSA